MSSGTAQASSEQVDEICRALLSPHAYPDQTHHVEHLETHISHVFLTDQFAYKLKKPVRFDFLDFSTVELRHRACLAELQLNRRLAADVYLDVVPIVRSRDGGFQMGGDGPPVDWLVRMHRLREDETLMAAIRNSTVSAGQISRLAGLLAGFYRRQPAVELGSAEYRSQIESHVRGNLGELLTDEGRFPAHEVRRIHAAQLTFLMLHPELFDARIAAGRIVDGHGDLRPEHVYLSDPPVVIDCIEFNTEFRHLDVVDELAFLETECALLDAAEIGASIRRQTMDLLGDRASKELIAFYKSYRACVRAKVAVLRARQLPPQQANDQLALAQKYLTLADQFDEHLGPPLLLLVCGLSGTGKSTVAKAVSQLLGIEVLQTDYLRQQLVRQGDLPADGDVARYRVENRQRVYDAMIATAGEMLAQHNSVILDGTFLARSQRDCAAALARQHGAHWLIIRCECPLEVAQERIAARLTRGGSLSEARPELVEKQQQAFEPDESSWPVLRCDTRRAPEELLGEVIDRLKAIVSDHQNA